MNVPSTSRAFICRENEEQFRNEIKRLNLEAEAAASGMTHAQFLDSLYQTSDESTTDDEADGKKKKKKGKKKTSEGDRPVVSKKKRISRYVKKRKDPSILKLFDRRVNLSEFTEGSSLYSLARAWAKDNPYAVPKKTARKKKPYTLPAPLPAVGDLAPSEPLRPYPVDPLFDINCDMNSKQLPTKEELLAGHRENWMKVKKFHFDENVKKEARYAPSISILKDLYLSRQLLDK